MFEVKNVKDLCAAAKILGNGSATTEAISALITAAKRTSPEVLFKSLISRAKLGTEDYKDPALKLERCARIAGLTGEARDFARAISLLPEILNRCTRARAKKMIVEAYLISGNTPKAREFAKTIKSHFWAAESWVAITRESKDADDLEHAKEYCKEGSPKLIGDSLAREEVEAQINALGM